MGSQNQRSFFLALAALGLLVPGVFMDCISLKGTMTLPLVGTREFYEEGRSVAGSLVSLWDSGNLLAAGLLLVFAIVLPLVNTTLIALAATTADGIQRAQFRGVAKDLSRWCMADVFAATLALVLFVTPFNGLLVGQLRWGFYCFAGYVLVSIASNRVQE